MPRGPRFVSKSIFVENFSSGIYYGHEFEDRTYPAVTQIWDKSSEAITSNHKSPTPYSREVFRRLGEIPAVVYHWNGKEGDERVEYTRTTHLSSQYTDIPYWGVSERHLQLVGNAFAHASTEVRNKVAAGKFETATFCAESKESANMLADTAKQLWAAQIAARKRQWSQVAEILGVARKHQLNGRFPANRWLEYQYGWRPLVRDAHFLWNQFRQSIEKTPLCVTTTQGSGWSNFEQSESVTTSSGGGVRATITAKIANNLAHSMQQWGLINPAVVAWELVPFSFCIDWGIPIGNFLNSLSATAGMEFVDGYFSDFQRTNWTVRSPQRTGGQETVISSGEFSFERTFFRRTLMPGFPMPQLYGSKNPFSTSHVANAVALATQLFSGYTGPKSRP